MLAAYGRRSPTAVRRCGITSRCCGPARVASNSAILLCRPARRVAGHRASSVIRATEADLNTKLPMTSVRAARFVLLLVFMSVASQWCLDRFWLYHAQSRVLSPSDNTVSVTPAASAVGPNHQLSDDGQFAVEVITRGTSHAMGQETNMLLVALATTVGGFAGIWGLARLTGRPV
jgi:hypothetical protein